MFIKWEHVQIKQQHLHFIKKYRSNSDACNSSISNSIQEVGLQKYQQYEITASNELSLTKTIVSGQTISWKYKYAGTVVKLSTASETTMDTIPALDCETEVLNQVSMLTMFLNPVCWKESF